MFDPFAGVGLLRINLAEQNTLFIFITTYPVLIKILFKETALKKLGWSCKIGYQELVFRATGVPSS